MWVPGHTAVGGNEAVDHLAKEGAEPEFTGPKPFIETPTEFFFYIRTGKIIKTERKRRWKNLPVWRQSNRLIPAKPNFRKHLELTIIYLRFYVVFDTGHCPLRYHGKKMGQEGNALCRQCQEYDEALLHIILGC